MGTWETVLVGVLVVLLLLWFAPGIKHSVKNSPKATSADWRSLALPLGLVALFVVLLIVLARG